MKILGVAAKTRYCQISELINYSKNHDANLIVPHGQWAEVQTADLAIRNCGDVSMDSCSYSICSSLRMSHAFLSPGFAATVSSTHRALLIVSLCEFYTHCKHQCLSSPFCHPQQRALQPPLKPIRAWLFHMKVLHPHNPSVPCIPHPNTWVGVLPCQR